MKKAIGLAVLAASSAFAATSLVGTGGSAVPGTIIAGPAAPAGTASASTGSASIVLPGVTLQDYVYFGTAWQMINAKDGSAMLPLGGGYANARIDRTDDHDFFDGVVEKLDANGAVTDVMLAFAGAQGIDALQAEALGQGIVLDEPRRAATTFEALWDDPRYANAKIHVTGHSLGAGYTQYVMAEAVATHGLAAVTARADFVGFGVPNLDLASAKSFGIDPRSLDGLFTGYTALNDPTNSAKDDSGRVGIHNFLPPFTGLPLLYSALNFVAAHWPTTYMVGLGLPDWLSAADKAAAIKICNDAFPTKNSYDPNYGTPGLLPLVIQGGPSNDTITGMGGDDIIAGVGGQDVLRGGGGNDRFMLLNATDSARNAPDEIADFSPGDRIDFSRMDANTVAWGTQAFTLVSGRTFTAPGQIATWVENGDTWVAGNIDADPAADFLIKIDGAHALTAADFVLAPLSADQKIGLYLGQQNAILWPYVVGNP